MALLSNKASSFELVMVKLVGLEESAMGCHRAPDSLQCFSTYISATSCKQHRVWLCQQPGITICPQDLEGSGVDTELQYAESF